MVMLLMTTAVDASYWISDFAGSAQEYRVIRNNETIAVEQLMLLQTGDIVEIDNPEGLVIVIDQSEQQFNVTRNDAPFMVPESKAPPQLLVNVRDWVASWWSTRGNQNTSSMAAVSKGGFDPVLSFSASGEKFLLRGNRKLHVAWQGGLGPFDVTFFAPTGEALRRVTDVPDHSAVLPEVLLEIGQYKLQVADGEAESSVILNVVDSDKLPGVAEAVMNLEIPNEIRFGHLAMLLSAYDDWRFEAFQIASANNQKQLKLDLLAGNIPESEFVEPTSAPGVPGVLQDNP